eukprot:scaffold22599_cov139-Cylindrotheca_fusiformis.AAC.10
MDAALVIASGALALYLPSCSSHHHFSNRVEKTTQFAGFGLCLGLFSLSILEAVPVSWLFFLSPDNQDSYSILSISHAYWLLLWCLTLFILVVLPSLVGVTIAQTSTSFFRNPLKFDRDNHKYGFCNCCPWWLEFVFRIFFIFLRNLIKLCGKLCGSRRPLNPSKLVLPTSVSSESLGSTMDEVPERRNLLSTRQQTPSSIFFATISSICGVLLCLLAVRTLGVLVVKITGDQTFLSQAVSWLCSVGLLVSSLLNGFGSVSMPHSCLMGLYLKPVPPNVIDKLNAERATVKETLEAKRQSLGETTLTVQKGAAKTFTSMGDEVSNRKLILQSEIVFLEDLHRELGEDIEDLKHTQKMAAAARTVGGKFRSYLGIVFSILLLSRLFSAISNIWKSYTTNVDRRKQSQADLVTSVLVWMSGHNFVSPQKNAMFSQIISLILTAFLSFSQVRAFLNTISAVNGKLNAVYQSFCCTRTAKQSRTTTTISADPSAKFSLYGGCAGYLAAFVGCCYSLSCIVLIKMMLPDEYCESFARALGGGSMDVFTIHTSVVNTAFTGSAGISASILAMLLGIQRQNNFRHTAVSSSFTSTMSGTNKNKSAFRGADAC